MNTVAMNDRKLTRCFHVLAKPAGSRCNLNCTYCYYLNKDDMLQSGTTTSFMSDDLLEEFVRQYIASQDVDFVEFTWHGGEPALLGLDFFRKVVHLQQKYARGKEIRNDLQTNGLVIDDEWCAFLSEHNFLVGLSIDGPKDLHDHFRSGKNGNSSFDEVCRAAHLLRKHGVVFNTMTVVNALNAKRPADVYRFLTEELGARRLQWLACVEPKDYRTTAPGKWDSATMPSLGTTAARPGQPDSFVTDWSVDPDDWGEFLCQTFDLWRETGLGTVVVNWFESLVNQWMMQPPLVCVLAETCGRSLAVEKDGSLYSCDHFVYPEYRLGNLRDKDRLLEDVVYSAEQRKFGCRKRDALTAYCKACKYHFACNGGCPKDRFVKTPDGEPGLDYLCAGTKRFLTHADPHLRQIVATLHRSQNAANLT